MSPYGVELSPQTCRRLVGWFHEVSGIHLPEGKRTLVASRLRKRLAALRLNSFDAYCDYLEQQDDGGERQQLIDLLTTNETYFFREAAHFDLLVRLLKQRALPSPLRAWSAACSSGEEVYSLAMTLSEHAPGGWDILATDLSTRVLHRARQGLYSAQRLEALPPGYLQRYFLKGSGRYEGMILVDRPLRARVRVAQHNLLHDAGKLGRFDLIFLRNVLIYFDAAAKQHILERILAQLEPGGYLFLGHAEALPHTHLALDRVAKSAYRRSR